MDGFSTIHAWMVPMPQQDLHISSTAEIGKHDRTNQKLKVHMQSEMCLIRSNKASGVEFRKYF